MGTSCRSGFSLHSCVPTLKDHVGKSITEEIDTYSTHGDDKTASQRCKRLKYWSGVDMADQVPGHDNWSIDVMTLKQKLKNAQGVVQACDLCRVEREKWRPTTNVAQCLKCQKESKICTFKMPWSMGKKKHSESKEILVKPLSKKVCEDISNNTSQPDNYERLVRQTRSKTTVLPHVLRLHKLGMTNFRDKLTSAHQSFRKIRSSST